MLKHWKRYYFRVAGFAIAGAGAGLLLDEIINAEAMHWTPANHEFWGLIMLVAGVLLISLKPKGKD